MQSTKNPSSSKSTLTLGFVNVMLLSVITAERFINVKFVEFRNALFCEMFSCWWLMLCVPLGLKESKICKLPFSVMKVVLVKLLTFANNVSERIHSAGLFRIVPLNIEFAVTMRIP